MLKLEECGRMKKPREKRARVDNELESKLFRRSIGKPLLPTFSQINSVQISRSPEILNVPPRYRQSFLDDVEEVSDLDSSSGGVPGMREVRGPDRQTTYHRLKHGKTITKNHEIMEKMEEAKSMAYLGVDR
ncbi:hypothetical protein PRIPAC_72345 [Pristionchus pacificus]|uniref:Uncharacterized protein n=1 Tax=Pristionchus pacificus TaxID=54126 RepID=A0A2A6C5D0_PRIPA|nr:hypothetical protein PRIPAC_72345 [Pristionchus pacificus]|eukprot:PDM73385.1 hypothetical protein PRIPAC_40741 [Pristionchus pacificus]